MNIEKPFLKKGNPNFFPKNFLISKVFEEGGE